MRILEEGDYQDSFQLGFKLVFKMETVLVMMVIDLWWSCNGFPPPQDSQVLLNKQAVYMCPFPDWKGLQIVTHAIITSQLNYCNKLYRKTTQLQLILMQWYEQHWACLNMPK